MTKEERRYKILKKKKYEEQISKEEKEAVDKSCATGICAIGSLVIFLLLTPDADVFQRLATASYGLMTTGFSFYYLKGAIEAVTRKTKLEGRVEEIINELKIDENNESRGKSR